VEQPSVLEKRFEQNRRDAPSSARNLEPQFRAEDGALRSSALGAKEGCFKYGFRAADGRPAFFDLMFYTYILESVATPGEFYRGHTDDLKRRLAEHNAGKCLHTSKFKPWRVKFYAAFETLELAQKFEKYLKSGSGHDFAKRHFLPNATVFSAHSFPAVLEHVQIATATPG
jgi:predicted GIY-YIG superfamily endonuclease